MLLCHFLTDKCEDFQDLVTSCIIIIIIIIIIVITKINTT